MANAPKPGTTPSANNKKPDPKRGFRLTINDEPADIYPADVGPRDDALVRHESSKPEAFGYPVTLLGAVKQLDDAEKTGMLGMDTMCTLWWWGRRKAGLTTETLAEALDRFPPITELNENFSMERIEPDEAEADPLPSAGD